ncbi:unnamed protein product [Paramecium sonneborni]|uniref:Transmembrane protein n=1 Tax=Paramecium sonneborni TaxID=65129 RepID=A0A8S1NDF6_9CILI|nr:unnamed protein product [Paramecium sonneborni]
MKNYYQNLIIHFSSFGILLGTLGILNQIFPSFFIRDLIYLLPLQIFVIQKCLKVDLYQFTIQNKLEQFSIDELKYISCMIFDGECLDEQKNQLFLYQFIKHNSNKMEKLQTLMNQNLNKESIQVIQQFIMQNILRRLESLSGEVKNPFKLLQIYINYIQILIVLSLYVEAQQIIEQLFKYKKNNPSKIATKAFKLVIRAELNWIYKIYLEILEDKIIANMQNKMIQKSSQLRLNNQAISQAIKQLSMINSNNIDVQTIFKDVVNQKIEFLNFIKKQQISEQIFSDKVHQILSEQEKLLIRLKSNYELLPTIQNQSILMTYQVQILNNILDAYQFSKTIALDENIILKHHQSEMVNFLSQSFSFVIFEIHDLQNIQIKYHSASQNENFILKEGNQLNSLIPQSLQNFHQQLIERFLQEGQNKYFQTIDETFIKIRNGIFQPIDICMDLNHKNTQNIEIISVYRSPQCEKQLILIDSSLKIQELSLYLYQNGFKLQENQIEYILGTHISKVIPNFKKYIDEKVYEIKNCPINFLNFQDEYDSKTKSKTHYNFDDMEYISLYSCHLNIIHRHFDDNSYYYILKIDNLKLDRANSFSQFKMTQNSEYFCEMDEEIVINIPDLEEDNLKQIILNTERQEAQMELLQNNQECYQIYDKKFTETSIFKSKQLIQIELNENSNLSSITKIKRSPYYKKFSQYSAIINSQIKSSNLIAFNIFYLIYMILILTFSIKVIVTTYQINDYISHLNLLSIKNEIYQPIESFLLTRYTILTYNTLLQTKAITQSEYQYLINFPNQNLLSGYDDLKISITKVLNIPEFQPFLQENYQIITLYEKTNFGVDYNITFREAIHLLLNYQYEYKLAYTIKSIIVDGPYFYYSYKNYIVLFKKFLELQNFTLDQTFMLCNINIKDNQLYLIIFDCLTFLFIILKVYHKFQIRQFKNKILTLIRNQDLLQNELEIANLKQLQVEMLNNRHMVYGYRLDIETIDKSLKMREKNFKQNQMNSKRQITLQIKKQICLINFHFLIFFGLSLGFYIVIRNYLENYKETALFYQKVSDTSVNVLTVYAWKEALYYKATFTFLNSTEFEQFSDHLLVSLNSLQEMTSALLDMDELNFLFGNQATKMTNLLTKDSVCDNLSDNYKMKAEYICDQVMQGVLTKGVINSLNYMINSVKTEYEENRFDTRVSYQKLELEGASLVSDVLSQLISSLKEEFKQLTANVQLEIFICVSLFILFELVTIHYLEYSSKIEQSRIDLLKKFIYLMPSGTLFYDEYFQRQVKRVMITEKLA